MRDACDGRQNVKMRRLAVGTAFAVWAALAGGLVGACSSGYGGECAQVTPMSCSSDIPSYAWGVSDLISRYCLGCHGSGGGDTGYDFSTLQSVQGAAGDMAMELATCAMPVSGPAPSDAERQALITWLTCGAPNN